MAKKNGIAVKLSEPIDLRYKCIKSFWGKKKIVKTTVSEQKHLKKAVLKIFPDNLFYDDLQEENSLASNEKAYSTNMVNKPINLRYRYKKNLFGKRVQVETSISEQQKMKKVFVKLFPDGLFYDDLCDTNSVKIKRSNRCDNAKDIAYDYFEYRLASEIFERTFDDDHCDCDNHDDCNCDDCNYDDHDDCDCDCDCDMDD